MIYAKKIVMTIHTTKKEHSEDYSTANVTSLSYACNTLRAADCSGLYAINDSADAPVAQPYIDFLQGTVSSLNSLGRGG